MQNDILTGNGAKSKPFFIFFGLKLYIVPPTAKPSEQTTRFCVWEAVCIVHKTYRPGPGGPGALAGVRGADHPPHGVKATKSKLEGYPVTRVDILDHRGEEALGKPQGSYFTIDLTTFWQRKADFFERAVRAVGTELKALLPVEGSALVVGLGNAAMTPDAVGPLALDSVLITRHLLSAMPKQFAGFRPVSAFRTGVLGTTGVESAEAVRGLVAEVQPAMVLAIDALASRRCGRVCATVQLSDTGIIPGSGVGNHRAALNRETLGVPVFAIGVPTVVDSATLAADILEESGVEKVDEERLRGEHDAFMVTTRDIDQQVRDLSKVVGYGINWALQDLEIEEMNALLS